LRGTCPLARHPQIALPVGPSDAFQSTLAWPSRAALRRHADRPEFPSPALPVSRICQPFSGWIVHGHPPFRGFSPLAAARPSRASPSSMPFPTLRCRGSEDFSLRADAFSCRGVVHTVVGSLLSWSFLPLRG
jgi:hypothetical protein